MILTVPKAANAAQTYAQLVPTVMTTFDMPHYVNGPLKKSYFEEKTFIERMPFAAFEVREPFTMSDAGLDRAYGIETVIISTLDAADRIIMVSKVVCRHPERGNVTLYAPHDDNNAPYSSATTVLRLYDALYSRKFRFVEQAVSRQVRRSESRPHGYREYVMVDRTSTRYATAIRPSDIIKRLRTLHAIRRFPRHIRNHGCVGVVVAIEEGREVCALCHDRITWVRAHMRGTGDVLQVKNYHVSAERMSR